MASWSDLRVVVVFFFVFAVVLGCDESVCVQFPQGVFRHIEADDIALRVDTACLCRDHVCPWKVDGTELALSEQEAMSLIRRVDKETKGLCGGINVTNSRHHCRWWMYHFRNSVLHLSCRQGG